MQFFDRIERKKGKRKRNWKALRDKPGRKLGEMVGTNWRSRPLGETYSLRVGTSRRHMSPASSGRVVPLRDNNQEAWRRAVSARDANNKWHGLGKPTAKPSDAPGSVVSDLVGEHSR